MGLGGPALIQQLLSTVAQDPADDISEFRSIYADLPTDPDLLYPGVQDTLAALTARGYGLSLCSNKSIHLCNKILADTGVDRYFPVRLGGNQTHKPNIEHWHALQAGIGQPEIVYYVGDSAVDREFCAVSGMQFIYANYGYGALDSTDGICYTITKFDQLAKMFL
jgi:phosphoglycolate phosphatase